MRAESPASSSSSVHSAPSTAPSTPPPGHIGTYFLVSSAGVLKDIPAERASADRIFYFQGTGSVKSLLAQAADVLEDTSILEDARWEHVATDAGTYYKTKADISVVEKSSVLLSTVECKTEQVGVLDLLSIPMMLIFK